MFELQPSWRYTAVAGLVTAAAVALVSVATGGFVVVPVIGAVTPVAGLALPLGLIFGPVAGVGIAAGLVLAGVLQSTLSWWTVLDALAYGGLAYLGYRLWGVLPGISTGDPPLLRSAGQWVEFVAVTVIACVIAALALGWGTVLSWGSPFHAVVLPELASLLVSTAVLGPVLLIPTTRLFDKQLPPYSHRQSIAVEEGAFWGGVAAPLLWLFAGTALSLVAGSQRIQLLGGAIVLSLAIATFRPRRKRIDSKSSSSTPTDA